MKRSAFTLVELLVVMVIIVVMITVTAWALTPSAAAKVNTAARVIQSRIMLAKNSATSDRQVRGVRLERSTTDPRIAIGLSMIGSAGYAEGYLSDVSQYVGSTTTVADNYWRVSDSIPGEFNRLAQRGLLTVGAHLQVGATWYVVTNQNFDPANNVISIAGHVEESHWNGAGGYDANYSRDAFGNMQVPFKLELQPIVIADGAPTVFPRGTAIDIDASQVPDSWRVPGANWDLLFSASGSSASGAPLTHLYVTNLQDIELTRLTFADHPGNGGSRVPPIVPANPPTAPKTEPFVVTVFKNTGHCYTSSVNQVDANGDLQADDPFLFGRQGREAK